MKTIAVYSLKGGVGKSTFAVNLAWASAVLSSRRTLLWDLDPQAAATYLLAPAATARDAARDVFSKQVDPADLCQPTAIAGLDLLAADPSLHGLERLLFDLGKKKRLARLIENLKKHYERVLLDCPPGLTETAEQVLKAADILVVPVVPSPLARKSLDDLVETLVRRGGSHPPILPVFSMVDRRRKLHVAALESHPDWPFVTYASQVEQMGTRRLPLGAYAPQSQQAAQFAGIWAAIERRLAQS
ncbi:ParA-like protein [Sphingobium sp. SYK-6]|uniref:ParA family protein n=1 Tax=Sphingobium sp. (strain NBRC 103272 / SYK-6) TaxID=627192 RepID=UPI00022771B9|nr:ParA family protein [Sphingobium sp. SYK-6]BAK66924.1 ParA-like protein [Sphingobium sp. SYK-6]